MLPAESCVLVFHRMSAWLDPSVPFGSAETQVTGSPAGMFKSIRQRMVQGKLLNICLCLASETWSQWRL